MSRYSHILFDHDGVLVNTEPLYYQATREVLEAGGAQLPLDEYLDIQAVGGNAWLRLADSHSDDEITALKAVRNDRYQELLSSEDIDIEGVEATLDVLTAKCTLAIVTTAKQTDFDLIHRDRTIVDRFSLILTNKDYTHSKPHPEPYLTALDRFGISAADALVVEDSERGLKAAIAAGIDCAAVHHDFTATQDFSAATYRVQTLSGLLELID